MSPPDDRPGKFYSHAFLRDRTSGPAIGVQVYDVDELILRAAQRPSNREVDTKSIYDKAREGRLDIDWDHVAGLTEQDLFRPAIGVTVRDPFRDEVYIDVADGNHRVCRAYLLGRALYPLIVFDLAESNECQLPLDTVRKLIELGVVP